MPTLAIKIIKNRRNTSETRIKHSNRFGITLKLERGTVFRRTPLYCYYPTVSQLTLMKLEYKQIQKESY